MPLDDDRMYWDELKRANPVEYTQRRRALRPTIPPVADVVSRPYTPDLEAAFPNITPQVYPCGTLILVQLRTPRRVIMVPDPLGPPGAKKALYLADETIDAEKFQAQTALVRAMGPVAFANRTTGAPWPEREWVFPGDFVRVPKFGGDRHEVHFGTEDGANGRKDSALFVMIKDNDILGLIPDDVDPLSVKTLV